MKKLSVFSKHSLIVNHEDQTPLSRWVFHALQSPRSLNEKVSPGRAWGHLCCTQNEPADILKKPTICPTAVDPRYVWFWMLGINRFTGTEWSSFSQVAGCLGEVFHISVLFQGKTQQKSRSSSARFRASSASFHPLKENENWNTPVSNWRLHTVHEPAPLHWIQVWSQPLIIFFLWQPNTAFLLCWNWQSNGNFFRVAQLDEIYFCNYTQLTLLCQQT